MGHLSVPDGPVQANVFWYAPELVDGIRGVLGQDTVLKNEAPAVMDCKAPVLAEDLVILRQAEAAATGAERVPGVVVKQRRVVRLDD